MSMEPECTCHVNPPCGFCTSLSVEEVEAFAAGGLEGLQKYRNEKAADCSDINQGLYDEG